MRPVALVALASIAEAVLAGVAAFVTRDVFAALHSGSGEAATALAVLALAACLIAGLRVLSRTHAEALGQSFARAVRKALYRHLAGMSRAALNQRRTGALALRFVGDLAALRGWVGLGIARLVAAAIVLPGAFLTLYLLSPALALSAAPTLLLALGAMAVLAPRLEGLQARLRSARGGLAVSMSERVAIAAELDVAGRTRREIKALEARGAELQGLAVRHRAMVSALRSLPEIGIGLAGAAVLFTALRQGVPAAEAAGALALLGILVVPFRDLATLWDRYCAWRVARRKCAVIFAEPSRLRRVQKAAAAPEIRIDAVPFGEVRLSAKIAPGGLAWVTGRTEQQVSGLLGALSGIDRPAAGKILFDGKTRPPRLAYIGATPPILQGSLRRALTLGLPRRPDDAVLLKAAEAYGIAPMLERLGGLDARISEIGRGLSPEEVFRLQLARAGVLRARVLVIDALAVSDNAPVMAACLRLYRETGATTILAARTRPAEAGGADLLPALQSSANSTC
ncbi:MAG: ABC transporter ATP-binding protein [Pseudomonadota bacterium]